MREYWNESGIGRITPDELDAAHLEEIISSLDVIGRNGMGLGELYAFILKLEFIEYGRPIRLKAEHVRRKFKQPCSERTYYYHYSKAKKAVFSFANPL